MSMMSSALYCYSFMFISVLTTLIFYLLTLSLLISRTILCIHVGLFVFCFVLFYLFFILFFVSIIDVKNLGFFCNIVSLVPITSTPCEGSLIKPSNIVRLILILLISLACN